ncbi:TRAP transporter small permease [Vibrio sp. E150_011]
MLLKLLNTIRLIIEKTTMILFFIMVTSVIIQVGGRYIFNYSIAWTTELATFSQVWLVILGAGIAVKDKMHAGVDVLIAKLSRRSQVIISYIVLSLCLAFLLITLWGTQQLLVIGSIQTSPALGVSMKYVYMVMPVGLSYIILELISSFIQKANITSFKTV